MYLEVTIVILALVIFLAIFAWRKSTFWSRQNVPFIKPRFPYGSFNEADQTSVAELSSQQYRQMKDRGRFFGMFFFLQPMMTIVDLDLIRTILIKEFNSFPSRGVYFNAKDDPLSAHIFSIEGEKWRSLRTRLTPTFTSGKLKIMFPTLKAVGDSFGEYLIKSVGAGGELAVKDAFSRFTTDVIGSCAFGIECNSFVEPNNEFREFGHKVVHEQRHSGTMRMFWKMFPEMGNILRVKTLDIGATTFFRKLVADTIEFRQKNSIDRKDFMSMLIELMIKKELTLNEVAAQSLVFFVAGFETSSSNQTYCLYELARNPECQEKARKSVLKAIENHGGLTYEAVNDMQYLDQCINETLRLYPAVPVLERKTHQNYTIPDTDVTIPKGMKVHIPVFAIHRDEQHYPDPHNFNPDRFLPEEAAKRHPSSFLTFGDGPRACIGFRFALLQSKVGLATVLSKFRISSSSKTQVPLKYTFKSPFLQPTNEVMLKVEPL